MDFFSRQDQAHKITGRLVVLFILAVLGILISVNVVAAVFMSFANGSPSSGTRHGQYRYDPPAADARRVTAEQKTAVHVFVTLGTVVVIAGGSLFKTIALRQGGPAVAAFMGATPVRADADDREKVLLNIVEEMSIASGVPMPQVFVMENEGAINAFAAGFTQADAVVCVTRGSLEKLNRDELQGVIAHEFSHILNGDVRLNIRLIGLLHGILLLGLIGLGILRVLSYTGTGSSRSRSKDDDKGGNIMIVLLVVGVAATVIGYVGVFFGKIIQAAVSRQREYLADASAVQFTRNPSGIAGALKKIGGLDGSKIENAHALEVNHMLFGSAGTFSLAGLLATHPPLEKRIKAIDPTFDGHIAENYSSGDLLSAGAAGLSSISQPPDVSPRDFSQRASAQSAGEVGAKSVQYAAAMLTAIPDDLLAAAREPFGARAVVMAVLIAADPNDDAVQIDALHRSIDPACAGETLKWVPTVQGLGAAARLPLLNLSSGALQKLSPTQAKEFLVAIKALVEADRQVTVFEYALAKVVRGAVEAGQQARPTPVKYFAVAPLADAAATVLGALARSGNSPEAATAALAAGWAKLGIGANPNSGQPNLAGLDAALNELAAASPPVKRRLIDACAAAVSADGVVQVEEAELLRAVAAGMGVPMPMVG